MPKIPVSRALLAAAALASLALLAACSPGQSAKPASAARPAAVGVLTLQPESLTLATELPGRTAATLVAEIRPQVGGIVQARRFTEGSIVQAGQVLYQLDSASLQATQASAQAAVAKAEAALKSARLTAERQAALQKIDAASRQEAEDAQAALEQAQAELASARAALQTARINLERASITSPIRGRVDLSTVTPGALVSAEQATALTTVRAIDTIQVDITQSSAEWLMLKRQLGQGSSPSADAAQVGLLLEDGSRYAQSGRLRMSGVSVNPSTGAVTLRAEFPNPDGLLLPGMYVRAQLPTATVGQALLVPQQAVSRNAAGQASVLLVGEDNKVAQRSISAERAVGSRWLVTAGLKAGERLVVEGGQKVKPGDVVQVQATTVAAR
ncbi:MAG: efflux RND transporter periplasmic adaptor subunit [Burkholderiaceae bacterium]|nr:efflux RND transporter periplasmic adaptor subunit [Burkholderiaceae bacterium]